MSTRFAWQSIAIVVVVVVLFIRCGRCEDVFSALLFIVNFGIGSGAVFILDYFSRRVDFVRCGARYKISNNSIRFDRIRNSCFATFLFSFPFHRFTDSIRFAFSSFLIYSSSFAFVWKNLIGIHSENDVTSEKRMSINGKKKSQKKMTDRVNR